MHGERRNRWHSSTQWGAEGEQRSPRQPDPFVKPSCLVNWRSANKHGGEPHRAPRLPQPERHPSITVQPPCNKHTTSSSALYLCQQQSTRHRSQINARKKSHLFANTALPPVDEAAQSAGAQSRTKQQLCLNLIDAPLATTSLSLRQHFAAFSANTMFGRGRPRDGGRGTPPPSAAYMSNDQFGRATSERVSPRHD